MVHLTFDVVVFGATGYTGEQCVAWLASKYGHDGKKLRWAVAGRNRTRLRQVFAKHGGREDKRIIVADCADPTSLEDMAAQATVLINCVGPFRFFGEPVVKACIAQGSHYVDITGEPEFVENMMLKYHKAAEDKGVYVVPTCGFDSVPADLGVAYHCAEFAKAYPKGALATVDSVLTVDYPKGGQIHFATFESLVNGFANVHKLRKIRKKLRAAPQQTDGGNVSMPPHIKEPNPPRRSKIRWDSELKAYVLPFPGSDASVVRNSQILLHNRNMRGNAKGDDADADDNKEEDTVYPRYGAYFAVRSKFVLAMLFAFSLLLPIFCKFRLGRWLLLKLAPLLTFGGVGHAGMTKEQLDAGSFRMSFVGRGYSDRTKAGKTDPDVTFKTVVGGIEPGYYGASRMAVEAAYVLLKEDVPVRGGVLTPAAALSRTSYVDRISQAGVRVERD